MAGHVCALMSSKIVEFCRLLNITSEAPLQRAFNNSSRQISAKYHELSVISSAIFVVSGVLKQKERYASSAVAVERHLKRMEKLGPGISRTSNGAKVPTS